MWGKFPKEKPCLIDYHLGFSFKVPRAGFDKLKIRETKTYFELAEKERIAVKRGRKYVNLIVLTCPF